MNFDDYELSDDIKAKIVADYEKDVKGLKAKNAEVILREQAAKEELQKAQLNMATVEQDAKIALAESGNNVEAYKTALAEKDALIEATKLEFIEKDKKRVTDMAVNDFLASKVSSDPAARAYMEMVFRSSIDVIEGEAKPKDVTKDMSALLESITKNEAYKPYIKVKIGSGGSSAGSTSTAAAGKSLSQMTATEEAMFANSQPEQYAQMTK